MEFGLKWVHMARYGLILKQDGAIWLRIISKPLLTPKEAIKDTKIPKMSKSLLQTSQEYQQRGFPRGSISSLGALGGAWIWI